MFQKLHLGDLFNLQLKQIFQRKECVSLFYMHGHGTKQTLLRVWWIIIDIQCSSINNYVKYLLLGGNSFISKYTGQTLEPDDLNTDTPSVLNFQEKFSS